MPHCDFTFCVPGWARSDVPCSNFATIVATFFGQGRRVGSARAELERASGDGMVSFPSARRVTDQFVFPVAAVNRRKHKGMSEISVLLEFYLHARVRA
jgi:hypothetical protein